MTINKDQAKGRVKEATGDLTGNEELQNEGKTDQAVGNAKDIIHKAGDKAEDMVDNIVDKVRKK